MSRPHRILMWLSVAWLAFLGLGYRQYYVFVYTHHNDKLLPTSSVPMQQRQLVAVNVSQPDLQMIHPQLPPVQENSLAPESDKSELIGAADGVVHIIHTRFMQSQPHLIDLGLARLKLMEAFLWSSLQIQTSKNFVLIIRTDPDLDAQIREPLQALLESNSGIPYVLIASNDNPHSQLRHLLEMPTDRDDAIWSGDWERTLAYLRTATGDANLVLESRLDADDALNNEFVETIQKEANVILKPMQDKYMNKTIPADCLDFFHVWCSARHAEWQYQAPWSSKISLRDDGGDDDVGGLVSLKFRGCITAGLTVGYIGGMAGGALLPVLKHQKLPDKEVPSCSKKKGHKRKGNCITFLNLIPVALRARTPTSAGMWNVLYGDVKHDHAYVTGARQQREYQEKLWLIVADKFGLTRETANSARQYLQRHLLAIATDNLHGQCTSGHSCKDSSQALLQKMIADAEREKKG